MSSLFLVPFFCSSPWCCKVATKIRTRWCIVSGYTNWAELCAYMQFQVSERVASSPIMLPVSTDIWMPLPLNSCAVHVKKPFRLLCQSRLLFGIRWKAPSKVCHRKMGNVFVISELIKSWSHLVILNLVTSLPVDCPQAARPMSLDENIFPSRSFNASFLMVGENPMLPFRLLK